MPPGRLQSGAPTAFGRAELFAALVNALAMLTSVVALVGLVVWLTGSTPIDPLLSLLIGGLVLAASQRLLREAVYGLMDGLPFAVDLPVPGRRLAAIPGIIEVHDLHAWYLSDERLALSAHMRMGELDAWPAVLEGLRREARSHGIEIVMFQPEATPSKPSRRDCIPGGS